MGFGGHEVSDEMIDANEVRACKIQQLDRRKSTISRQSEFSDPDRKRERCARPTPPPFTSFPLNYAT